MRFTLLIFFLIGASLQAFSQVNPIYFNGDRVTTNADQATSYGVYGKLNEQELWVLKRYDLDDNLMFSGAYKDELLTKPHGKFIFYASILDYNYQNFANFKNTNTDRYISQQGEYIDGLEEGKWTDYFPDGRLMGYRNYLNGKLNDETVLFNYKGRRMFVGQYTNGLKTGTWYNLKKKVKDVFDNDKIISTTKLTKAEILAIE